MEGYFLILELQSFSFNFYLLSISAIETLFYKLIRILFRFNPFISVSVFVAKRLD